MPATIRITIASPLMLAVARSARPTPSISRIMAPTARISSGRIGWSDGTSRISVIAGPTSMALSGEVECGSRQKTRPFLMSELGGLGAAGGKRVVVVVDQRRHRSGRHVEHRLWPDPEQDRERDERREDRDLARTQIAN